MPPHIPSNILIWLAAFGPPLGLGLVAFTVAHIVAVRRGVETGR